MVLDILESQLHAKLYSSRPMRVKRVQERRAGHAVRAGPSKTRRIGRAGVATDYVISTAARIIGIVASELGVIKNVECLGAELKHAGLPDLEMFEQCHVEIDAARIVQEISACVTKCKSTRRDELPGVPYERTGAPRIAARRWNSPCHVWVRGRDAEPAGNSGIVGK